MAEYKITQVSANPPKEYDGQNGRIYYIKVALQGHAKPVSVGKKTPNALRVGDTVNGTILPTEYDTDNFKSENKPYPATQGGSPKDQDMIRAQWAIGQAVQISVHYETQYDVIKVEKNAKDLFAMVDRVKGSNQQASTPEVPVNSPAPQRQTFGDGSPVPDVVDDGFDVDAPISLNDIPF